MYNAFAAVLILVLSAPTRCSEAIEYTIELVSPPGRSVTNVTINDYGDVVYTVAPEEPRDGPAVPGEAFLWDGLTATSLGSLGGTLFVATGINRSGEVVGYGETAGSALHSFLFASNSLRDLGPIGPEGSLARAINNPGDIVGELPADGSATVFLRKIDGTTEEIGPRQGFQTIPFDINDSGAVVGTSRMNNVGSFTAFLYQDNQFSLLGTAGDAESGAIAVNGNGQIVGVAATPDGIGHAAIFNVGGLVELLDESQYRSSANDINNLGTIVGQLGGPGGQQSAAIFPLRSTPILIENLLPANSHWTTLFTADGVNDRGQIVGTGIFNHEPGLRAYIMTPIPEPSALAGLTLGFVVVTLRRFRRRRA
jgi:probable HAF family extracellular repeat protein